MDLKTLFIRGTQITDAGLVHLKGLTNLKECYYTIVRPGLDALKMALPASTKHAATIAPRILKAGLVPLASLAEDAFFFRPWRNLCSFMPLFDQHTSESNATESDDNATESDDSAQDHQMSFILHQANVIHASAKTCRYRMTSVRATKASFGTS